MDAIQLLKANLLAPVFLAFVIGWVATLIKSDLKFPPGLYTGLSAYLMLAIGLKGGSELATSDPAQLVGPVGATLVLGVITPLLAYVFARRLFRFEKPDAAALAAHYGSVSAVTFIAAVAFSESIQKPAPGFMPALVAILEIPAIMIGLAMGRSRGEEPIHKTIKNLVASKSIFLLLGGLVIGLLSNQASLVQIKPLFGDLFRGALVIFMLEMGILASLRFKEASGGLPRLIGFAIIVPILNGLLGTFIGIQVGMPLGGAAVLGAMASSASYIAAPAAVRSGLPQANPGIYLPAAVAITFPFNLALGIPIYFEFARMLVGK